MTLNDLLGNSFFRGNQTLLSNTLNINRGTLRKYLEDTKSEYHFIKCNKKSAGFDEYELFTNTTKRIKK